MTTQEQYHAEPGPGGWLSHNQRIVFLIPNVTCSDILHLAGGSFRKTKSIDVLQLFKQYVVYNSS